jgi:methionyl-tRNA synthetase
MYLEKSFFGEETQMQGKKIFYITTPIYYVNDIPHIGHAYTTIAADVIARYKRMCGYDVLFSTGTDEHGQKIQRSADVKGLTPQELADRTVENFKDLWKVLNISHDDFIRTTEKRHEDTVKSIFNQLTEQGDIYKGKYEGWYCVPCETYVPQNSISENNTCPDCGRPLEKMTEESYFLRVSKYEKQLLEHYENNLKAVMPKARYNEIVSFIRSGLRDQSISRTSITWGIPVPGDEEHVIYVWFDALINYLTVCGYPDGDFVSRYWPEVRHLVGKDIIRFHCVVWPIIVMALGLNPPVSVFGHGWWTVEGDKMSKSKGNVVDPFEMVSLYGVDPFRYFLLREVPFGLDGDFSEKAMVNRINSDLANDLGNLLNRTLQMVEKFRKGTVPAYSKISELDDLVKKTCEETFENVDNYMNDFAFDEALKSIWMLVSRGNKYIDETMPWKLGKEGEVDRLDTVLYILCEVLRSAALLIAPFMPNTSERIWEQLGLEDTPFSTNLSDNKWGMFPSGTRVKKGSVLYPRLDMEEWKERKKKRDMAKSVTIPDPGNHEEQIEINDFANVELRVAQILDVEPVKKADKLYKIEITLGYETRTIVSGIRKFFDPSDLIGKKIIVVCNLKPAKLRGVESKGMLLAAGTEDDSSLALLVPNIDVPNGTRVS